MMIHSTHNPPTRVTLLSRNNRQIPCEKYFSRRANCRRVQRLDLARPQNGTGSNELQTFHVDLTWIRCLNGLALEWIRAEWRGCARRPTARCLDC